MCGDFPFSFRCNVFSYIKLLQASCLPPSVQNREQKLEFSLGCQVILPPESFLSLRLPFVYGVQLEDGSLHPLKPFEHQPELTAWITKSTTLQVMCKGSGNPEERLLTQSAIRGTSRVRLSAIYIYFLSLRKQPWLQVRIYNSKYSYIVLITLQHRSFDAGYCQFLLFYHLLRTYLLIVNSFSCLAN